MMYATHRGIRYGIQFTYHNDQLTSKNGVTRNTECTIYALGSTDEKAEMSDPSNLMGCGFSYQHPSDNFCREIGRKISLSRALENCGATDPIMDDKEFRRQVWDGYLNRNLKTVLPWHVLTPDESC